MGQVYSVGERTTQRQENQQGGDIEGHLGAWMPQSVTKKTQISFVGDSNMRQCYFPSLLPDVTHVLTLVYLLGTTCLNPCIHIVPVFLTPFLPSLTSLYSPLMPILQGAIYMPPLFYLASQSVSWNFLHSFLVTFIPFCGCILKQKLC